MKKIALLTAALAAFAAAPAMAGDHTRVNIGFYAPAPVHYRPAPVYYPARVAYVAPPCHQHYSHGHGRYMSNRGGYRYNNYAWNDTPYWGRGHGHH